jgi:hypothetical protein
LFWWHFHNSILTSEERNAILDAEKQRLRSELIIEKKTMSSYIRAKTSAHDERPSSKSIGYVGIAILCMAGIIIVLFDIATFSVCILNKIKSS